MINRFHHRPVLLIQLVLFSMLLFPSCSEKKASETEPNNTFSTANSIEPGTAMEGFIDSREDRDYYIFTVNEPGIVDVKISGIKGVNHSLYFWKVDLTSELLKIADDNRKSSAERLRNMYVVPGSYCVSVQHGERDQKKENRETPYVLTMETRVPLAEELEPNDSILAANPIPLNSEVTGFFSPAYNRMNLDKDNLYREEDWFSFNYTRTSEQPVILSVGLSGVPGINSELALFDDQGSLLASSDNAGAGIEEAISGMGITREGMYYVRVLSKGYTANNDMTYILRLTTSAYDESKEFEVNDTMEQANTLSGDTISGAFSNKDDNDCFIFTGAPGCYRMEIVPGGNVDIRAKVYSADQMPLAEINNCGPGEKEVYANLIVDTIVYLVLSSSEIAHDADSSYTCRFIPVQVPGQMEREGNNRKETATPVHAEKIYGFISYKNDRDYYLLANNKKSLRKIEITGVKNGEIKVSVTDPLGYAVKSLHLSGDDRIVLTEMIEGRGYLIIESVKDNYEYPYSIQSGDGL
ncbi:MAG TPA: hypothetical protein PK926_04140 [Spirochaetota bacterium]|nr:hypothetical protein [Spirochaetota bacterium]HPI89160.1 hypothetical protein [Spirochaetota bacterium]HPR46845.1 hypothetical protein [Spirochaetota bacterium]